jgi:hypothetical protein
MKLNATERIQLLGILPEAGNIITLRIVNDLRNDLALNEKEVKTIEVVQDGPQVRWNPVKAAALVVDVKIGDTAKDVIKTALQKLDKEQKLTMLHVPLWDKFMA